MTYTKDDIQRYIVQLIAMEQHVAIKDIDVHSAFHTFGLDSISAIYLLDKLEDHYEIELNPIAFFDHPTIDQFSDYLLKEKLLS